MCEVTTHGTGGPDTCGKFFKQGWSRRAIRHFVLFVETMVVQPGRLPGFTGSFCISSALGTSFFHRFNTAANSLALISSSAQNTMASSFATSVPASGSFRSESFGRLFGETVADHRAKRPVRPTTKSPATSLQCRVRELLIPWQTNPSRLISTPPDDGKCRRRSLRWRLKQTKIQWCIRES